MTAARDNKIILIADDCELNRDIIALYFGGMPFEVLLAEDGQQALQIAKDQSPDFILMDMQMPIMNGFDATKAIRAHELKENKPASVIISISGLESSDEQKEIAKAGCTDSIVKPIRKKALLEKINKYLSDDTTSGLS